MFKFKRKSTVIVFVLLWLFTLPGLAAAQDAGTVPGEKSRDIPVEIFDNMVYINVGINGSPLTFVLDTGAGGMSAIDTDTARGLKLELKDKQTRPVGAGEGSIDIYRIDGVTISPPGFETPAQQLFSFPLSARMDPFWGKTKRGMLGGNVLSRVVTVIDYVRKRVSFYDPAGFKYSGSGEKIPFTKTMGTIPMVKAKIKVPGREQLVEASFLVDTGARMTVFNTPFVAKHKLLESVPHNIKAITGFGIGGETRGYVVRMEAVKLGAIEIKKPVMSLSTDKSGALASDAFDGIVGGDFLYRFTVTFDYSRNQMILEKNKYFNDPFEFDMSGIFLRAEGTGFSTFKVFRLLENSPATRAGLREGDIIHSIDGKKAASFTLETIKKALKKDGRSIKLKIQRDGKIIPITLGLKRQV
ncbi:MAG: PDZ domain-containing protein [bacterium]|nr:PDZ domain-containing protein [bacterium]